MSIEKKGRPRPEDPGQLAADNSKRFSPKNNLPAEDEIVKVAKEGILKMPLDKALSLGIPADILTSPEELEMLIRAAGKREMKKRRAL